MISANELPMPLRSRIKISGYNCIAWQGKAFDVHNGVVSAVLMPSPGHPNAGSSGYVPEHRLVVERRIGRYLTTDEVVHHIDLDPLNNDDSNLLLLDSSLHGMIHAYLQIALVRLMEPNDLRRLTLHLVELAKQHGPVRKQASKNPKQ